MSVCTVSCWHTGSCHRVQHSDSHILLLFIFDQQFNPQPCICFYAADRQARTGLIPGMSAAGILNPECMEYKQYTRFILVESYQLSSYDQLPPHIPLLPSFWTVFCTFLISALTEAAKPHSFTYAVCDRGLQGAQGLLTQLLVFHNGDMTKACCGCRVNFVWKKKQFTPHAHHIYAPL